MKIINEFQSMFNRIAKYSQAQNNHNIIMYKKKNKNSTKNLFLSQRPTLSSPVNYTCLQFIFC